MSDHHDQGSADLIDERLDRRLTDHGARWRDALPEAAEPVLTRGSRREMVAVGATAAAVLALFVTFAATNATDEPDRGATAPTSPDAGGPTTCGADDLVAGGRELEGSAGTVYLTVTLELAPGVEPCTVAGYPEVVVLNDGRPGGVETVPDEGLGEATTLTVLPDRPIRVTLGWAVFHFCGSITNDVLRLQVAPGLTVEVAGFGPTSCNRGEGRPAVRVGPFTYVDPDLDRGTVTGLVGLNGGPAPGTGEAVTSGEIEFVGESEGAATSIGPDGSYEIEVPTGEYQVTVSTPQWNGGKPYSAGVFTVTGGELNELNVILPVR